MPPSKLQHSKAFLTRSLQGSGVQSTHLWSNIVGRAAEGCRGDAITDALLAHSEVCQFTVTLVVQQHIVQFQISGKNKDQQW